MTIGFRRFATWILLFIGLRSFADGNDCWLWFAAVLRVSAASGWSQQQATRQVLYLQDIFVADLRSAFTLITDLQKQLAELQLNKDKTVVPPSPSTPSTVPLTPSPAPGAPVSSCTPTAIADADVLSPKSASTSSRSYPPLVKLDARYLGSADVPVQAQPAQGGSLDVAASAAADPDFGGDVPEIRTLASTTSEIAP